MKNPELCEYFLNKEIKSTSSNIDKSFLVAKQISVIKDKNRIPGKRY
jgi:hypothetical protein